MMKSQRHAHPLRSKRLRTLSAIVFLLLTLTGLLVHSGWGTASAFSPWDIAALCPLGAIEVMVAEKAFIPRVLIGLFVAALVCIVLGRVFCGWLCPVPLLGRLFGQNTKAKAEKVDLVHTKSNGASTACSACFTACPSTASAQGPATALRGTPSDSGLSATTPSDIPTKEKPQGLTLNEAGPYAVLIGAIGSSAIFGFPVFCLVCPVGLTFATMIALWRVFEFNELSWSIVFFAGFLILELFVLRRWCHRFCPLGAMMTLLSRLNHTFRPTVERASCLRTQGLDCNVCRSVCPENISLAGTARENGTVSAGLAAARCTKCHACADACPAHAIRFPIVPGKVDTPPMTPQTETSYKTPAPAEILSREAIRLESARCIECGACARACPAGKDIPAWMVLLRENAFDTASRLMLAPGNFPEVCGRICPAERLCESVCPVPMQQGGPIQIQKLERSVVAPILQADALNDRLFPRFNRARRGVAIIGAGPAGLSCAETLLAAGIPVTIFDRESEIGGLLTFGIPAFKLEKELLTARRRSLVRAGAKLMLGHEIGRDIDPASLTRDFCAVFLSIGAGRPVTAGIAGEDSPEVLQAGHFLADCAREALPILYDGAGQIVSTGTASAPLLRDRRVVVIGAGDTAIDCLRTALARGASEAVCLVRRDKTHMRALPSERALAEREGAHFLYETTARQIVFDAEGKISGLELENHATSTTSFWPCDVVISACGFRPSAPAWLEALGVECDERGCIRMGTGYRTTNPMVFAGGDAVRGPALAVNALTDGRKAAYEIALELGVASRAHKRNE